MSLDVKLLDEELTKEEIDVVLSINENNLGVIVLHMISYCMVYKVNKYDKELFKTISQLSDYYNKKAKEINITEQNLDQAIRYVKENFYDDGKKYNETALGLLITSAIRETKEIELDLNNLSTNLLLYNIENKKVTLKRGGMLRNFSMINRDSEIRLIDPIEVDSVGLASTRTTYIFESDVKSTKYCLPPMFAYNNSDKTSCGCNIGEIGSISEESKFIFNGAIGVKSIGDLMSSGEVIINGTLNDDKEIYIGHNAISSTFTFNTDVLENIKIGEESENSKFIFNKECISDKIAVNGINNTIELNDRYAGTKIGLFSKGTKLIINSPKFEGEFPLFRSDKSTIINTKQLHDGKINLNSLCNIFRNIDTSNMTVITLDINDIAYNGMFISSFFNNKIYYLKGEELQHPNIKKISECTGIGNIYKINDDIYIKTDDENMNITYLTKTDARNSIDRWIDKLGPDECINNKKIKDTLNEMFEIRTDKNGRKILL